MLELIAAAAATALATGVGAIPVFAFGARVAAWRATMYGFAGGVMMVAAIVGLLLPGEREGGPLEVAAGAVAGVVFLVIARGWVRRHEVATARDSAASLLVFAVLFLHSLPEGFAIGTAYASATTGLGLFVVIAIAIQNVPEGTSVAIPMSIDGRSASSQFWTAVLSSALQPVGAVIAYVFVEQVEGLLPLSFGFAAGAMLALVIAQLLPVAVAQSRRQALVGLSLGVLLMLALSAALHV